VSTTTWSTKNKLGLALQLIYGLANVPSIFQQPGSEKHDGPPMFILWIDTVLGVLLVLAVVIAWRNGNRTAAVAASAANVLLTLSGIPVFFVGAPVVFQVIVSVAIVLTIVSVTLTHARSRPAA